MKKSEIVVGGYYVAKVAGRLTTVRVDAVRESHVFDRDVTMYDVTNMVTQRRTTFRSAAKFRSVARQQEGEQRADPTTTPKTSSPAETTSPACGVSPTNTPPSGSAPECVAPATTAAPTADTPAAPSKEDEQCSDPTRTEAATDKRACEVSISTIASQQPAHCMDVATDTLKPLAPKLPVLAAPSVASAFAAVAHRVAPVGRKYPLTDEQVAIVEAALGGEQVLVVEAGAGCGKTSTQVEVANALPGRGQYTAFNTSLVAESRSKFGPNCPCNTIHSLAFHSEGHKFSRRLGGRRVMGSEVAAMVGLGDVVVMGADGKEKKLSGGQLASCAQRAVRTFCQSADRELTVDHVPGLPIADGEVHRMREHVLPYARKMWEDCSRPDGTMPFAHDHYVKVWQLNRPVIAADYVLLDEAQDTSPVMLDVLAQQVARGTKVILVGDSAQQIYSWRGAVNALAAFPDARRLFLSQSFRFGQVVAEVANAVLAHLQDASGLVMRGLGSIPSRLGKLARPKAVLCRTNAAAVQTMLQGMQDGRKVHLIGGGDEVLRFVRAALDLQQGRTTEHPELSCFDSWGEVKAYVATEEGEDLKLMVKLVDTFGAEKIAAALKYMPREDAADLVVSTAHKSKGREWSEVKLAGDFMPLSKMGDEELRLLYVAATRAQKVLDVETCPPFCGGPKRAADGWNGEGGMERTIDLREARRLSKQVEDEAVLATAPVVNDAEEYKDRYVPQGERKESVENTWTKSKRGEWCVRGKPGQSGVVTVVRRNGSKSQERLGKVVWSDAEVALYAVEAK